MAQFTAGASRAEPAVSTTYATPLALGVFAFTTAILGCIFARFIVSSAAAGISLLAAVAFFGGLVQLLIGLVDLRQGNTLTGTIFAS